MLGISSIQTKRALLVTSILCSASMGGAAFAQQKPAATGLEEVVVTATRQADTVNRVPLSISAQTQRSLDERGIHDIADLTATVPALNVSQLAPSTSQVTIRGIANTTTADTAPTTGFYLDDTPIQKRNTGGGVATNNGTPLPPLFDLERVEVLRGPQGTLYGGSSEGGTIRYITPAPSLTRYSAYARAELSSTHDGGTNYNGGVAVGGPIITDKLGFRASVYGRRDAGWIDQVNPLTDQVVHTDINSREVRLFRGALTWAPTENARVTLAYLESRDHSDSVNFGYMDNTKYPIVEPVTCYNTTAATPTTPVNLPGIVAFGAGACAAATAAGAANFTRPGYTYPVYNNLGPYRVLGNASAPSTTLVHIPTLTFDYNFAHMSFKSITSYVGDETKSVNLNNTFNGQRAIGVQGSQPGGTAAATLAKFYPTPTLAYDVEGRYGPFALRAGPAMSFQFPDAPIDRDAFTGVNYRHGVSEEARFSSDGNAKPFSWVAGVFYSNMHGSTRYYSDGDLTNYAQAFFGLQPIQRYGVPALPAPNGALTVFDFHTQKLHDIEVAAFGEGNLWVTDKLRVTVGLRQSRVQFDYQNYEIGAGNGFLVATTANGGISNGTTAESPFTPKFGAEYQITSNDMVYVTAAKGFRTGGVNVYVSPNVCAVGLGFVGLTVNDIPQTYNSDSVWSYEAGTKLRLLGNRLQFNADAYRIDWSNVQISTAIGCGVPFVVNGAGARSQGMELETQASIFNGLTANLSVGYDQAKYTQTAYGPKPSLPGNFPPVAVALKDQPFPIAPWTVNFGMRYEHELATNVKGYARFDYRYASNYFNSIYGSASYSPDTYKARQVHTVNARVGVQYRDFEINVFANNLLNYDKGVTVAGGRGTCTTSPTSACENYASYNPLFTENGAPVPRIVGVQATYRY